VLILSSNLFPISVRIIVYVLPRTLHITPQRCW